jgi:hypothetical protein
VVPILILAVPWRKESHKILNLNSTMSNLDISGTQVLGNTVASSFTLLRQLAEELFKLLN